jgi:hypothetical protein
MKNVLLSVVMIILFSNCSRWQHQYPEDTERSKETPVQRLLDKKWVLQNVTLNGTDYTDSVFNQIGNFRIAFYDQSASSPSDPYDYYYGSNHSDLEGPFGSVYMKPTSADERISMLRSSNVPLVINVPVIYYITDQINHSIWVKYILRLESTHFKISFSNQAGDTTITNTFISN